jgi:hypothetical protein
MLLAAPLKVCRWMDCQEELSVEEQSKKPADGRRPLTCQVVSEGSHIASGAHECIHERTRQQE